MSFLRCGMAVVAGVATAAISCNLVVGSVDDLGAVPSGGGGSGANANGGGGGGPGGNGAGGLLGQGEACGDGVECVSGFCVDGVCCESLCDGVCEGCDGALTGSPDGVCASFYGTDPDMECTERMVCGSSGACEHGVVRWAVSVGGSLVQSAEDVAIDAQGNIYVVGRVEGAVDFSNTGCMTACTKVTTNQDAFVMKLDASGVYQWALLLTGPNDDSAHDVAIDGQGNVIVIGQFVTSIDLAGTNLTGDGTVDGFWLKLDAAGQYVDHAGFSETGDHVPLYLALDANGASFVASELFINPPSELYQLLLTKIDANGATVWSELVTGDRNGPVGLGVRSGEVYVLVRLRTDVTFPAPIGLRTGAPTSSLALWTMSDGAAPSGHVFHDFGGHDIRHGALAVPPGSIVAAITTDTSVAFPGPPLTGLSASDVVLATLDGAAASTAWKRKYSTDGKTQMWGGLAVDPLDGAIVGVGYQDGTLINLTGDIAANMGVNDAFVMRISAAGTAIWARGYGEVDPQPPAQQRGLDVALDPGGDIVMVGDFDGEMAFGDEVVGPAVEQDAFVVKLSP